MKLHPYWSWIHSTSLLVHQMQQVHGSSNYKCWWLKSKLVLDWTVPCLASMEIVQFFKERLVSNPGETRLHAVVFLVFWYHLIDAVSLITQWMKKQLMRDVAHNIEEVHSEADGSGLLRWWCLEGCDSTICVMLDLMVAELIQKWVPSKFRCGVLYAIPYIHLFSDGFSGWNASKS